MKPRIREWTRDKAGYAKVRRLGFAIVPEFGGTIHGYCGETLDAILLDLLEWHRKPSMEDMHKAYVGRSRTRQAHHMLLVQPYSPHLFRQGQLPVPAILMKALKKELNTQDAKTEWKQVEKAKRQRMSRRPRTNGCATCLCRAVNAQTSWCRVPGTPSTSSLNSTQRKLTSGSM